MSLPPFIDLPGSSTYQPPYKITGGNTQTFFLRASYDRLVKVTDQWLNSVPNSQWKFVPLLPFVMCTPTWFDRIYWTPEGKGWMRETDFNFVYPVAVFRGLELDRICIAPAYLVVDNPFAVMMGREVYGFRKVKGEMEYMGGTYQPAAAFTWVFKSEDPNAELEWAEVARVLSPPGWPYATQRAKWEDVKAIAEVVEGDLAMDAMVAVEHFIAALKTQSMSLIHLLQLRDVEFPTMAGYQALIEAPIQIKSLNNAWVLGPDFSVKLTDYPSYPIISDLGIEVDENNIAKSHFSYQTNFDGYLQTGKVLAVGGRTSPS
jgi:hypothetical protein